MNYSALIDAAKRAREHSYSPYSSFSVGAALLCDNGKIYDGCNIEAASFSPTCCAERVAIFKAISEGARDFSAIAIVGGKAGEIASEPCFPCGVCRQVMAEFCDKDFKIIVEDEKSVYTLDELLPNTFSL